MEGVYSFPMFSDEFCAMFIEEVEYYAESGLPVRRPNSMNNYGLIVNEIGMEPMISNLQVQSRVQGFLGPGAESHNNSSKCNR